ncbi:hypothetical protein SLH49_07415 [Cognatiyoonia sp. IB215446]|uniref:hypothetical protein n=1 Tax=Cognatiyoonia sp. IB215446 TaxID=3097355 RepID=UPI002A16AA72|nr:hypothetical protein [Cognatiyoonia sp. IB215446]MDX8347810.1 hypothetical protein [Cognatiyoonia sp. IB215446]
MKPIKLLCEIVAQKGKVAASSYSRHPYFSALLAFGFLERAGAVQSVPCLNCDNPHNAEIVHHSGRDGFFCPEMGFIPVAEDEINAVRGNTLKIINALADAFDCRARKSSPVAGQTWRVGKAINEAGDITIYFHPTLRAERDATELSAALAQEPGSTYRLILSAAGKLKVAGTTTVPLLDVVELDVCGAGFRRVADLRDLVGAPRKNLGGAPNRYGETLSALIRQRIVDGSALDGRNEEARAVLSVFKQSNPLLNPPSLSSVQDYVTKVRAGQ